MAGRFWRRPGVRAAEAVLTGGLSEVARAAIDRDGDGIPNWKDGRRGHRRDRDGDGIPDRRDRDRDGDGIPNRAEHRQGRPPHPPPGRPHPHPHGPPPPHPHITPPGRIYPHRRNLGRMAVGIKPADVD